MSASPREFLMAVEEGAYKTPAASPTIWATSTTYGLANAQAYYCRLDGGNAFSMRPRPVQVEVPYGGGVAVGAYRVADKLECKGRLKMKLSVAQAPFWLSWAGVRIAGGTAPWTTTEPNGDLASCSIYHAIQRSDGTFKRRVYLGCKVDAWTLACSEASTVCELDLEISASTPQGNAFDSSSDPSSGTFPSPLDTYFPSDPFVWIHTGGAVTIAGSARTAITELTVSSRNVLARSFYNQRFIGKLRWVGRKTTIATKLEYAASPDDRTAYEGLTAGTVSIGFNNGTHGFVLDCKAQNVMDPFEDDLPLDNLYWQSNTENNLWDNTAGTDLALTFS
jgi:tail tube protein